MSNVFWGLRDDFFDFFCGQHGTHAGESLAPSPPWLRDVRAQELYRRHVSNARAKQSSKGGRAKTEAKRAASAENMRKAAATANASYTPEKRRLAAQKRLATMAAKKQASEK